MGLTPQWVLTATDAAVAARLRDVVELRVETTTDRTTDTVEITLAGLDAPAPPSGAAISVAIGYREQGPVRMGTYWHTETELALAPERRCVIRATGADLRPQSAIKAPRSRSWDDTTVGEVVAAIAREHGFQPAVGAELAGVAVAHIDQSAESDLHLLRRMAARWDATAKMVGGEIVFARAGTGRAARGAGMPILTLSPDSGVVSARVTYRDRPKIARTRAAYTAYALQDPIAHVTAGEGDPVHGIPDPHPDQHTARAAAAATLARLRRAAARLEATLPGAPDLSAGANITTTGWPPGANGPWIADRVTHTLSSSGYTTEITATAPTS